MIQVDATRILDDCFITILFSVIQEFHDAMKLRFAMIEVKKSQGALSKSKAANVNITNEIKIITANDEVYELWKEVISRQSQGLLLDPESMKPLRDVRSWDPENDGVLKREFFKHLGNTTEYDLKRLALHLLNRTPKRTLLHPKVMMKKCHCGLLHCKGVAGAQQEETSCEEIFVFGKARPGIF